MRDVFYTLLVVWIIWRIMNAFSSVKTNRTSNNASGNPSNSSKEGKTSVDYSPPKKKSFGDNEGEYVDFEEVK